MTHARDPYEVLGVPRTASTRQIRAAYVARARLAHPDLVGRRGLETMRVLNDAWEVLKDLGRRATFDASAPAGAGGPPKGQDHSYQPSGPAKPFWTGAAGPPPGRPWGPVLDFGIYAGWSLGEIARIDRGYLYWLRDRDEAQAILPEIARLLEPTPPGPEPQRPRRR